MLKDLQAALTASPAHRHTMPAKMKLYGVMLSQPVRTVAWVSTCVRWRRIG